MSDNPLRLEKLKKLAHLREKGIDPFPYRFDRTHSSAELLKKYEFLQAGEKHRQDSIRVAGRLMTKRAMGKAAFFNIQDQTGTLQVYLKSEELDETSLTQFEQIDLGDIVGLSGFMFRTQKGELSLYCEHFSILCKTVEPLPEKFHGLTDVELRYRHRHLDLIVNPEKREIFLTRARIIRAIRDFLDRRGFMEVETPILQPVYGGAMAYPFRTHHRALDMTLYLKISPELYLKRLIVGGFDKVYDLGKNFRNEGIDRSHNPEFTMLEWYEAFTDYNDQMKQFEELIAFVAMQVCGTTRLTFQGKPIDLTPPWRRLTILDGLKEIGKLDVSGLNDKALFDRLREAGSPRQKAPTRGEMIAELFAYLVEPHLWDPTFVKDFPVEISPLTKNHRTEKGLVERFEPIVAHMEIGNSYSELNAPDEQLNRLKEQEAKRVVDEEAQPMDEDFMHAIDVGMPPTGGVGLGIDRLVMLLTDQASIRDVIFFPTMKPK